MIRRRLPIGIQIPYDYLKGEGSKLVLDPETAPTVKLIFDLCLQGYGPTQIARLLTEKGNIPTPGTIEAQRAKRKQHYHPETLFTWSEKSVAKILEHKEYLGPYGQLQMRHQGLQVQETH